MIRQQNVRREQNYLLMHSKNYDQKRREKLPENGIIIIELSYKDFGESKSLKRNETQDKIIIRKYLKDFLKVKNQLPSDFLTS